jgi:beta-phosphoglucomutase family hydrolase
MTATSASGSTPSRPGRDDIPAPAPSSPIVTLSPRDYDAVLLDLDGVLTRTASVHAAAWKKVFDAYLRQRSQDTGEPFVPFDIETDYRSHVDGKPRLDGVVAFLASRGIELPHGSSEDEPAQHTVHALGRQKDTLFLEHLHQHGVERYEPAVALVHSLREHDIRTAVVSSSNNCAAVLAAAGISDLFDARVDGLDLTRLSINGKPDPASFLEAARRLDVEPARAVVVEDAIAGVEAGRAGGFGLVIAVDRGGQSLALRRAAADVVVASLSQVSVAVEPPSAWALAYDTFDPAHEGTREALCALGNGYVAARGAAAWAVADGTHYPATYLAGGYNRLTTDVAAREVENEDLVNLPNWLAFQFRIGDGPWFDSRRVTVLSYRQELDLRRGMLLRTVRFADDEGRQTTLRERRLVSMADKHIAALEIALTAEDWSGPVTLRSAIDGRVVNAGTRLYRHFDNRHLVPLVCEAVGDDGVCMMVRTSQSRIEVAQAATTTVFSDGVRLDAPRRLFSEPGYVGQDIAVEMKQGSTVVAEKLASLYTSRDHAISDCRLEARRAVVRAGAGPFEAVMAAHVRAWKHLWRRFDVYIEPGEPAKLNALMLLRLNMFHLLQTVSTHSIGLDVGVPARGWTGEAYQGHIFWDELYIFPFFNYRMPEITRSLLLYRYRRLGEARAAATRAGFRGAMFPWQSGSNGEEVTQLRNLNPRSGRWVPDNSHLQRHVGSAIVYNVWQYFQVTEDLEFLEFYGAELIFEIARFWSSIAHFDAARGRYEIHGVMGPDEYHEGYPGADAAGLKNNAYTNIMAVWVLWRALDVVDRLSSMRRAELMTQLDLGREELARWADITRRMYVPIQPDGIISQFEGFDSLRELDWQLYRAKYGDIQRLDLILEAEGDSPNRYKLCKQADVLMLFYLFSAEELGALFARLGYPFDYDTIPRNVAYYDSRSSHGSTLSRVVHAWVLARSDRPRSLSYFAEALQSDVNDIQQGTTAEGVHLGAMAGTVDLMQRVSTGIEIGGNVLRLNPRLPQEIDRLDMRVRYRGHSLTLRLTRDTLTVRERARGPVPIRLGVKNEVYEFAGGTRVFPLSS